MDSDAFYAALGGRLRSLRKGLGLTQEAVARNVGVSRASLANIEAGRQQVLVHHLVAFADALDGASIEHIIPPTGGRHGGPTSDRDLTLAGENLSDRQREEILQFVSEARAGTRVRPTERE